MRVTGYAFAWDVLDDPGFAARARDLGVDEVAVALSYHTTRAATPWQPGRAAVNARHAALYRPVTDRAWAGRRLRPEPAHWLPQADAGGRAVAALRAAGIPVAAWLSLLHSGLLGDRHPDLVVRDCFGEPLPWALCPSREEVREYAATLAAEALAGLPVDSVVLESCGQMGVTHPQPHEKTDAVWSPAALRLLSVCCCDGCAAGWRDAGLDPDRVRGQLRDRFRALVADPDLGRTDDGLPAGVTGVLLAVRRRHTDALRAGVLAAIRGEAAGNRRVVLHASPDPWATGPLPGLTPRCADDADAVVVGCWPADDDTVALVGDARAALPGRVAVGGYVTGVAARPIPDVAGYLRRLAAAGADELHLYHLGLAGPARLPHLREAVRAWHRPSLHRTGEYRPA